VSLPVLVEDRTRNFLIDSHAVHHWNVDSIWIRANDAYILGEIILCQILKCLILYRERISFPRQCTEVFIPIINFSILSLKSIVKERSVFCSTFEDTKWGHAAQTAGGLVCPIRGHLPPNRLTWFVSDHRGIIEDVYLLGAPVSGREEDWRRFSTVVAGQITNAYCR